MKISRTVALFLLVFRPRKLIERTNADYKEMNTPEAIRQQQEKNKSETQAERSINQIRSSLFWSFVMVAGAVLAAGVIGRAYFALGGARCQMAEEILQYSGIGVLL
jgi:hypothetical protein